MRGNERMINYCAFRLTAAVISTALQSFPITYSKKKRERVQIISVVSSRKHNFRIKVSSLTCLLVFSPSNQPMAFSVAECMKLKNRPVGPTSQLGWSYLLCNVLCNVMQGELADDQE